MKKSILFMITLTMMCILGRTPATQAQTWQAFGPTGENQYLDIIVHPTDPLKVYIATSGGVYRTTNGGSSWSKILSGFFRQVRIDPQNPDIVYTGQGSYGIYKSTNGGDTWTFYTEGMTDGNVTSLAIAANSPNILFMSSF